MDQGAAHRLVALRAVMALAAALVCGAGPASAGVEATPRPPVHNIHASHTRLVFEGRTVALRVRLFHDDLQAALRAFTGRPTLQITAESRQDSLFIAYYRKSVRFELDGRPVTFHVTGSAVEPDDVAGQVVWYVLEGEVSAPPTRLVMLNGLLFEAFDDQQNIVQILQMPSAERRTLYFTARAPEPQDLPL